MIRLKREIKILTVFLTMVYGVWAEAQAQPQANGYGYNSGAGSVSAARTTTNTMPAVTDMMEPKPGTIMQQEAPSDITTVNPMDPIDDTRRAMDPQSSDMQRRRRAMAPPVSATVDPMTETPMGY